MSIPVRKLKMHPHADIRGRLSFECRLGYSRYEGAQSQQLNPGFDSVDVYDQDPAYWLAEDMDMVLSLQPDKSIRITFQKKGVPSWAR